MERLLGGLIDSGIPAITLYADPKVVTLYEKLGFARDPKVRPTSCLFGSQGSPVKVLRLHGNVRQDSALCRPQGCHAV